MPRNLSADTIERMVRIVRPAWTVRDASPTGAATDAVYHLTVGTDDGTRECVLKACTAVPPADFRPEPYLFTLLGRRTAVPGPRVLGAVDDHADLPSPFYLMERCEGVTAEDADLSPGQIERLARAAGRFAGEYHAVGTFERFGRIRVDSDLGDDTTDAAGGLSVDGRSLAVGDGGHASWRSSVGERYRGWIADLEERFVDLRPDVESFVEARLDALDRPFDAVLGHVDYKPWNVLVRPGTGETTAVLDWGHASAMAPYYDLVLTEEHLSRWAPLDSSRRRRVRTAIAEGYAETNAIDRDGDFEARRELYLAVSRLQPLVHLSEWYADDPDGEREAAARHRQFVTDLVR